MKNRNLDSRKEAIAAMFYEQACIQYMKDGTQRPGGFAKSTAPREEIIQGSDRCINRLAKSGFALELIRRAVVNRHSYGYEFALDALGLNDAKLKKQNRPRPSLEG